MKKVILFMTGLGLLFVGCQPKIYQADSIAAMTDDEFMAELAPWMQEGAVVSDVPPAPGIPSAMDALKNAIENTLDSYDNNPYVPDGATRRIYPLSFLEQVRIEEPILVYNFRNARSVLQDYYYIISAVHPTYGEMRSAKFSYTPTGGFNCGSFVHTYGKLDLYDLIDQRAQATAGRSSILGEEPWILEPVEFEGL